GIGLTDRKGVAEVLDAACSSGSNNGNIDFRRKFCQGFIGKPVFSAIVIHGRKQKLPSTTRGDFFRPVEKIYLCGNLPPYQMYQPLPIYLLRIDCNCDALAAKVRREVIYKLGIPD